MSPTPAPPADLVLSVTKLGFPWATVDPFLFCAYHDDHYPAGTEGMGPPTALLAGRNIGQDFAIKDGFRMYHGSVVPGFPQHPHRGFETVTLVRHGLIDHSDSLGASARFGRGDVQWLTAGAGIVHAEMFPLLDRKAGNPLELFQIWLNLPAADKMAKPHFSMLWNADIPNHEAIDETGKKTTIRIVAGKLGKLKAPPPPPKSWAAWPDTDVAIWTLKLAPGARFVVPRAQAGSNRTLYFFAGSDLHVAEETVAKGFMVRVRPDADLPLQAGNQEAEVLMLQGRPIGEPVVQYGPFVMNSRTEIEQAFADYRRTQFGGWPWPNNDPVHGKEPARFAKHADGRVEKKTLAAKG